MKEWYYNEYKQTGLDFENEEEVMQYDEKFKSTRNVDVELGLISKSLNLNSNSVVLEIGTGTGEMAIRLSKLCKKVFACDVSEPMLRYTSDKIKKHNINNIELFHSGFLDFTKKSHEYDAIITQLSLHHLPDLWKSLALKNVYDSLKEGGKFYLLDTIISSSTDKFKEAFESDLKVARDTVGERLAQEIIINIRDEFPTYDWIIEGLLRNCQFTDIKKIALSSIMSVFICSK